MLNDRVSKNKGLIMKNIIIGVGVVILLGLVGQMDMEEAQAQGKNYNDMVCSGAWPDYKDKRPSC